MVALSSVVVLASWMWWLASGSADAGRFFAGMAVFYLAGHLELVRDAIKSR